MMIIVTCSPFINLRASWSKYSLIFLISCNIQIYHILKYFNLKINWVNNVHDPTFIRNMAVRAPQSCVLSLMECKFRVLLLPASSNLMDVNLVYNANFTVRWFQNNSKPKPIAWRSMNRVEKLRLGKYWKLEKSW